MFGRFFRVVLVGRKGGHFAVQDVVEDDRDGRTVRRAYRFLVHRRLSKGGYHHFDRDRYRGALRLFFCLTAFFRDYVRRVLSRICQIGTFGAYEGAICNVASSSRVDRFGSRRERIFRGFLRGDRFKGQGLRGVQGRRSLEGALAAACLICVLIVWGASVNALLVGSRWTKLCEDRGGASFGLVVLTKFLAS